MVGHFPTVYPDEIMYSVLSRYHADSCNKFTNTTLIDLFGKNTVRINTWLQGNLSLLTEHLPILCTLTTEKMIEEHSLLPVFSPFVMEERMRDVKQAMININAESNIIPLVHTMLGAGSKTYDSSLFYCTDCIEADKKEFEEAYWHRVHQIPGILVCPYHKTMLKKYFPPERGGVLQLMPLDTLNLKKEFDVVEELDNNTFNNLINIAEDLQWLLTCDINLNSSDFFYLKYRYLLIKKGLATPSGNIKGLVQFQNEFINYYGIETLKLLDCADFPVNTSGYHWLYNITRKSDKSFSPIHHVLISRFLLDGSIKQILEEENPNSIFGNGPWYCLNAISPHYKQRLVIEVGVKYSHRAGKPIGIFNCEHCGFTYSILGIPNSEEDECNILRVNDFGWFWKEQLSKLIREKQQLKIISEKLHQGTFMIKKQVALLGLETPWKPYVPINNKNFTDEELKEEYRAEWLKLVSENPNKTKKEINQIAPSTIRWLNKHDKEWLIENTQHKPPKEFVRKSHINWKKRDKELVEKVKILLEEWNDFEKPIRKTLFRIEKKLNITYLHKTKYFELLPLTMDYLKDKLETIDDFQLRRVRLTIIIYKNQNESVTWWKVLDAANLNPDNMSAKVKEIILKEIEGN